jgi:hypothetical protein
LSPSSSSVAEVVRLFSSVFPFRSFSGLAGESERDRAKESVVCSAEVGLLRLLVYWGLAWFDLGSGSRRWGLIDLAGEALVGVPGSGVSPPRFGRQLDSIWLSASCEMFGSYNISCVLLSCVC